MCARRVAYSVDEAIIDENTKYDKRKRAFAKTLNSILEERGIHQRELAERTGIAMSTISAYRNGLKMPKGDNLLELSEVLNVDCHYLLTGIKSADYGAAKNLMLSQPAIEKLKRLAMGNAFIDSTNDFIASDAFFNIVSMSSGYRNEMRKLSEQTDDIAREHQDLQAIANGANLYEYYATKALSRYFDKIRDDILSKSKMLKKTNDGYKWIIHFENNEIDSGAKKRGTSNGENKSNDD